MDTRAQDDKLRLLAIGRVKARRDLVAHVSVYIITNLALVGIWAFTGGGYPWFVWPALGWGIGVAFHVSSVVFRVDVDEQLDAPAIDREMERLRRSH